MRLLKRFFDIFATLILLLVASPIILMIGLLVWLIHGSPILFRQQRPGYKGRPFTIYKFRSMTNQSAPLAGGLDDAQRLTPFGRGLRALSLDELPELFNILRGDMSIVGPRPLLMEYLPRYSSEQMRRHDTLPGLTGWAQVNGRNAISWQDKFKLDVWYVDNWSLWLDLKIILLTIWKVFKREGITQEGQATTEYFMGNEDGGKNGD